MKRLLLLFFLLFLLIGAYSQGLTYARDMLIENKGADIASATTLNLAADGNYFDVTGTTAITAINPLVNNPGQRIRLHFDGILTLTHHATNLILPTGANITTAAGDEAVFIEYATDDWRMVDYMPASGEPLAGGGATIANDANNRVTTALGDGTLNAEANLTFDGDELDVGGTSPIRIRTSAGESEITTSTSDASDTRFIIVNGGGDSNNARGGYLLVGGNENVSFPGQAKLVGGNVATGDINFELIHTSGEIQFEGSLGIEAFMNNSGTWDFNDNDLTDIGNGNFQGIEIVGIASSTIGVGTNIQLSASATGDFTALQQTPDGLDIFGFDGAWNRYVNVAQAGSVTIDDLSGTGTRLVTADASGVLDAATVAIKLIDIGDWNMDLTGSVSIAHGLTLADIKSVTILINEDVGPSMNPLISDDGSTFNVDITHVVMNRIAAGRFDNASYDATSFNRGQITIIYTP